MAKKEVKPVVPEKIKVQNVWPEGMVDETNPNQKFIYVQGQALIQGEIREVNMDQEILNLMGCKPPYLKKVE